MVNQFGNYRYPFSPDQDLPVSEWEIFLKDTATQIIEEQSPQRCVLICCGAVIHSKHVLVVISALLCVL